MCGFAGIISHGRRGPDELQRVADWMADAVAHRGPDAAGTWVDATGRVALGHRRLAVIDLTPDGGQPMTSSDGRFTLAYNGEVYGHAALRRSLERDGVRFRGTSDTEVLVEAIATWGLEPTLRRIDGMFALAVWDARDRVLTLARDRFGEKPLYVGRASGDIVFGSQLDALRRYPGFTAAIDRGALVSYLRHGYVPPPRSILSDVTDIPPAHAVTVALDDPSPALRPVPYWTVTDLVRVGERDPFRGSLADAADEVDALLEASVAARLVADVPVGVFLSGGVDSSLVTAIMRRCSTDRVRSFSIGFDDPAYDETAPARAVADHLGTEHTAFRVAAADALRVVPQLAHVYDAPFADSSQIPTMIVAQLARDHVTVALTGDGGDELFAGYDRYRYHERLIRMGRRVPRGLARALMGTQRPAPALVLLRAGVSALGVDRAISRPTEKLEKALRVATATDRDAAYVDLMSLWRNPVNLVAGAEEPAVGLLAPATWHGSDTLTRLQHVDLVTYLPGDILTKVDRAAMSVALETRIPLLSVELVAFAFRLPPEQRVAGGTGKAVLRDLLRRHVPERLVDRPKTGFGVPLAAWLRGPLRSWGETLLDPDRLDEAGTLDGPSVRRVWDDHVGGRIDGSAPLWAVLMYRAWACERGLEP